MITFIAGCVISFVGGISMSRNPVLGAVLIFIGIYTASQATW